MQQKLISMAEYGRLRGLNRSTVSRQVAEGKIPTVNGKIDPEAADLARENNIDHRKQVGARANQKRAAVTPISDEAHDAVLDTLARIATPSEILRFARAALAIGCTPVQAFGLALWFGCQIVGPVEVDPDELTLERFPEPTRRAWKHLLGPKFDFEAGDAAFDRITIADITT